MPRCIVVRMSRLALTDPWEVVRDGLREQIFSHQLVPGQRLFETNIAEEFGVSRGPVREAIRALEVEGLVIREPRIGSMVIPIDRRGTEELYSFREAIEVFAVRKALERNPSQLKLALADVLATMRGAGTAHGVDKVVELDITFHTAFVLAADHDRLIQVWQGMTGPLRLLMGLAARLGTTNVSGHNKLFDAVTAGDADACAECLRDHIGIAYGAVSRLIDEDAIGAAADARRAPLTHRRRQTQARP